MFIDVTSFAINLQQRRDATFFLCGQVCSFIHQLCFCCYEADTILLKNAWFSLLRFKTSEGTFISQHEFLIRLKMVNNVAAASKLNSEGLHFNKLSDKSAIDKTADTARVDFYDDAMKFIQYVLGEVLQVAALSADNIKGLAAFDPNIMFKRPVEVALRHFEVLSSTFQLRSWVTSSNEATCRDEYIKLLDTLRTNYPSDFDITSLSPDVIEFLIVLEFFHPHDHLLYLFRLCCLCMTTVFPQNPAVVMGRIDTTSLRGRLADLILPCQRYLSGVPNLLSFCCEESSLEKISLLSASFGQSAFSPSYDTLVFVNSFRRSSIY